MLPSSRATSTIRQRKLYEQVAEELQRRIERGELRPGDYLPSERELMSSLAVGRPAIREALFSLQGMGLISVRNGTRARVTEPTPAVVIDALSGPVRQLLGRPGGVTSLQQARALFETALARLAAATATRQQIRRLEAALARNRASIEDDIQRFEETDVAFHYVIASIAGNPIFTALHEAMLSWLREQRTISLRHSGQNRVAYRAHERIFQAIAAGDPDRAERAMQTHLDQVARRYWTVLDRHGMNAAQPPRHLDRGSSGAMSKRSRKRGAGNGPG